MFRDTNTTKEQLNERFFVLKIKLDQLWDIYLDAEYHREMKKYIEKLTLILKGAYNLDEIRDINMTRLNRIQKIKNAISYKKEKYVKRLTGEL